MMPILLFVLIFVDLLLIASDIKRFVMHGTMLHTAVKASYH